MEEIENESLSPRSAGRGFVFVIAIIMLGIGLAAGFLLSGGGGNAVLGRTGALVSAAFERMVGSGNAPMVEIPIADIELTAPPSRTEIDAAFAPPAPASKEKKPKVAPRPRVAPARPAPKKVQKEEPKRSLALPEEPPECEFVPASPTHLVLVNEVAWMGTKHDANGEWVELRNNAGRDVSLAGWQLLSEDENLRVRFGAGDVIRAGGFFMLERKHDRVLKKVKADRIFEGSISNRGAWLRLVDEKCGVVDEVDATAGWKHMGGETASKKTLERNIATFDWGTSVVAGGTPAAPNNPQIAIRSSGSVAPALSLPEVEEEAGATEPTASAGTANIIISEVLAGTEARADEEFVELWNPGPEPVALTGWSLKKRSSSGAESTLVSASRLEGRSISGGAYLLLANQSGWAGEPPAAVTWPGSYTLAYASNAVLLVDRTGAVMDELAWTELPKGQSISPDGGTLVVGLPTPGR